jgi:23S rRNA (adenine2503-C2)-methyltransferase
VLNERGEARYRARQLYHALYRRRVVDWTQVRTLPQALRSALAQEYSIGLPEVAERVQASDGTVRYLLALADGKSVEAVFIPEDTRDTLCISTQVGCPVDCRFCLTALMGLERNLEAGEIVGQVLALGREHGLDPRVRPVNIVMMGMGEPLLNLPAVLKATRLLADPQGMAIPLRRITVSTAGITPQITALAAEEVRPRLAVSLNASTETVRRELMPITRKYPLDELLEACRRYPLRPWERLTFEYVLLRGINDSDADARRVVRLLANLKCKVNLIAFNPGGGIPFETPEPERVTAFQSILRASFPCFVRKPRGRDIYAACGQLKRTLSSEEPAPVSP